MFHLKLFYLSKYTFFSKIEICLSYFAGGFKMKFIDMMKSFEVTHFLKNRSFE